MGGGDKALIEIDGETILDRVLERIAPQCSDIILNANGDPARFAMFGCEVVSDDIPNFAGPLAGILVGLDWAATHAPGAAHVLSVPADCPFLPRDLVARLRAVMEEGGANLACARSGEWRHPTIALWPVTLRHDLRRAIVDEDLHKIEIFTARYGIAIADWPSTPIDPFFNVNTPDDAALAEALAREHEDA
jgi:molybdopterin-guanine dinucleotide biosynthesis protein A